MQMDVADMMAQLWYDEYSTGEGVKYSTFSCDKKKAKDETEIMKATNTTQRVNEGFRAHVVLETSSDEVTTCEAVLTDECFGTCFHEGFRQWCENCVERTKSRRCNVKGVMVTRVHWHVENRNEMRIVNVRLNMCTCDVNKTKAQKYSSAYNGVQRES